MLAIPAAKQFDGAGLASPRITLFVELENSPMIKETSLATIEAEQSAFRAVALPHLFSHVSDSIRGDYEEEEGG